MTTRSVGFLIHGEFIADLARTRVVEGAYDYSIRLLQDLDGISLDQIVQILTGEKTLSGNSRDGIDLIDMDKTSDLYKNYMSQIEYVYGSIFTIGDVSWRPYATVTGPWNEEDNLFAMSTHHLVSKNICGSASVADDTSILNSRNRVVHGAARSMFYANDFRNDMLCMFHHNGKYYEILCEKVNRPPFWMKTTVSSAEEYLRSRLLCDRPLRLESRGAIEMLQLDPNGIVITTSVEDTRDLDFNVMEKNEAAEYVDDIGERYFASMQSCETSHDLHTINIVTNSQRKFEQIIDKYYRSISSSQWDLIEEARKGFKNMVQKLYRSEILSQAERNGGVFRLDLKDDEDNCFDPPFVMVPLHPFIHWALRGFKYEAFDKVPPEWRPISPPGMKMAGDDQYHTDFLLGAGCDPTEAYEDDTLSGAIMNAAWEKRFDVVKEWVGVEFSYLSKSTNDKLVFGEVVHAQPGKKVTAGCIAICKNASVDYSQVLESINKNGKRGIIICETGGKLAHMAIVGREYDVTIILVPDALKKYAEGMHLSINLETNIITFSI